MGFGFLGLGPHIYKKIKNRNVLRYYRFQILKTTHVHKKMQMKSKFISRRSDSVTVLSDHFLGIPVIYQGRHTESSEHWAAEESHLSSLLGCQLLCLCLNDSLSCPERAHLSILSFTEPSLPSGMIILGEKVNGAIYNWPQICFGAFWVFFSILKHSKMSTMCAPASIIFAY